MSDELAEHLNALKRNECYRVCSVLKQSSFELTERVFFVGQNGAEMGPFVRKTIDREAGLGIAYEDIYLAQRTGRRFLYLPRIYDCHDEGDSLVVIMEYVGGETLQDVVYRCDPSLQLACDVFPRLCDAVSELHGGFEKPLIHRDLKPSNIMLSRDSMTIIDFGIARTFKEESDSDTHHFGTRAYAPPEQFGFGQTDVRSDIYALGMLLYFCLTEKTPVSKARKNGFRSDSLLEPVRSVILKATAFDPKDRFVSVFALKSAFLAAAGMTDYHTYPQPLSPHPSGIKSYVPKDQETSTPIQGQASFDKKAHAGQWKIKDRIARTRFGKFLSSIPFGVGVAWDIFLVLTFVLLFAASIDLIIDPTKGSSQYAAASLQVRALLYGSLALLIIGPSLYLVSDRRPFARCIPRLAQVPLERDIAVCLVALLIGVVVFGISCQFLPAT